MPMRLLAVVGAGVFALAPVPGQCQVVLTALVLAESAPSISVSFADLDLATQAGMKTLRVRVEAAAATVCHPSADIRDLRGVAAERACLRDSISRALIDVSRLRDANLSQLKSVKLARR